MPLPALYCRSIQVNDKTVIASDLSLRGPNGAVAISGRHCDFAEGFPTIRLCTARLPRRFAPRNDNLGECRGAPAPLHGLIPLYKALTARKGHAASVRRKSRQRLRRDRRYRRNRSVRFYRHLARTGSAFPRLPRRFAPRNDTSGKCRGTCPSPTLAHAAGRHIPYLQSGDFGVK